jgi:hypothetical protein
MKNNNTICDNVKVVGSSHITKKIPCQDFSISEIYNNNVILINCDGAGSAKYAEIGSKLFAELFFIELKSISDILKNNNPGEWIIDEIVISISNVRKQIRNKFKITTLSDYHTTLVAIISGENGGFICHIGDGYGLAITDRDFFISEPENGEYANETFFATESNWIKHIRITPFGGVIKFLGVMSDGAGSLFESHGKFNNLNLYILLNELIKAKSHKDILNNFLSNETANKKSNDDKSISLFLNVTTDFKSLLKINNIDYNAAQQQSESSDNDKDIVIDINKKINYAQNELKYNSFSQIVLLIISCLIILILSTIALDDFFKLNLFNNIINSEKNKDYKSIDKSIENSNPPLNTVPNKCDHNNLGNCSNINIISSDQCQQSNEAIFNCSPTKTNEVHAP